MATVEATRAELTLVKAANDLQAAFALLGNAIGQPEPARPSQTSSPILNAPTAPMESLFEAALQQRPELDGRRSHQEAAAEALKAAKALRFGSVTAIGVLANTWWGREERPGGKSISNPDAQLGWYGLGGTSAFPLYTGGRISGRIEEAEARQGEADAATQSLANQIVLQVAQAYFSRLTAEQQMSVSQERVGVAREALTRARDRYKAGLGSILDVVTATSDLLAAEVGLAESQYELQASEAALVYATGTAYGHY